MRTPSPRLVTAGLATITIALALCVSTGARTTEPLKPSVATGPVQPKGATAAFSAGPVQPIQNFSHLVHVTVNKIQCLHCHAGTEKSQLAGVPAVATCVGCHLYLGRVRQKPGVLQLFTYWDKKEPIPWVRVHYLPQFAQFKHKSHIRAGVACQTCHGPVQDMNVVGLNQKLTMGWCVGCHTNTQKQAKLAQASKDCDTCHY